MGDSFRDHMNPKIGGKRDGKKAPTDKRAPGGTGRGIPSPTVRAQHWYGGFEEIVDSGEFTSLVLRADGPHGTLAFTLKADLVGIGPMYLHGYVRSFDELHLRLSELLAKGDWRYDRYARARTESPDREG